MKAKYQALSPDNIPINCEGGIYTSYKKAQKAVKEFANNYKAQGYYSQTCYNGYIRHIEIPLIPDYCNIIKLA